LRSTRFPTNINALIHGEGGQDISIQSGCLFTATIIHEIIACYGKL
jgi:hypothetical protein